MEIIINLASLALHFLLIAFVLTALVSFGSTVLRRKPMHFWSMFRVTCVILLILNLIVGALPDDRPNSPVRSSVRWSGARTFRSSSRSLTSYLKGLSRHESNFALLNSISIFYVAHNPRRLYAQPVSTFRRAKVLEEVSERVLQMPKQGHRSKKGISL